MIKRLPITKIFFLIANIFFLLSAILAVYFYKERILYIDSAFQIFQILNFENFNIEASRYGVVFTQILPLLAIKLGLSLKSILIITSLSFILINYLVFLLCYKVFKEKSVSFIIPATLIVGISHGFFYTFTETYQAIVFLVAFYAWINTKFVELKTIKNNIFNIFIAFLLFLQSFFCHPVAMFPALIIIGYHIVYYNQFKNIQLYILIFVVVFVSFAKLKLTGTSSYEGELFSNILKSPGLLLALFSHYSAKYFLSRIFLNIYFVTFIFTIVLFIHYILKKKCKLLIYWIISSFVFWCILVLTFYQGGDDIAMEKVFAPFSLIIIIPFAKEIVFSNNKYKLHKSLAFIGIVVLGFIFILKSGNLYEKRISYMQKILKNTELENTNKFLVEQKKLKPIMRIPWAVSIETLLLSAIETPDNQRTIYVTSNKKDFSDIDITIPNQLFVTSFWLNWQYNSLNKKYFKLKPCKYKWFKPKQK